MPACLQQGRQVVTLTFEATPHRQDEDDHGVQAIWPEPPWSRLWRRAADLALLAGTR
jgi:hypothetical protein